MGSQYFASVQVLRGLAALMVVFYHIQSTMGFDETPVLSGGVDLFFVISGFVMVVATQGRRHDPLGFIGQRLARIVPLYWVATAILVAIVVVGGIRPVDPANLLKSLFFVAYYDDLSGLVQPVLNVGWTLNLEIVFYLVFAATMLLPVYVQVAAIGTLFAVAVGARVVLDPPVESVLFFYTTPMLLEFVAGAVLGALASQIRRVPIVAGYGLMAVGVCAAIALGFRPELPRSISQGLPSVLLLAGAVIAEPRFRARGMVWPKLLGDSSYSLYLMHPIVLLVGVPLAIANLPLVVAVPLMVVACISIGLASYLWVEKPIAWALRRRRAPLAA